ncbi:MAG: Fe-S cluster assembly protein SufB, partial [Bacteroidales bacterium]|nr:Fe-S cluster assembly protein SufB [Bacteroidales bacterium]
MDTEQENQIIKEFTSKEYKEGFVTDLEQEYVPKGLSEDIIRMISQRKEEPQWLLDFRLDAFRRWQK